LNTQKSLTKVIGSTEYKLVKVSKDKMYGTKKIKIEEELVRISNKERTLVDFIYNPIGSWAEVESLLEEQIKQIDMDRFIRYLIRFPIEAEIKRAGFMLERLHVSEKSLKLLHKSLSGKQSYVTFNPFIKSRKGEVNKKWQVIING
jgi:predicted transcriptional regulator of viral defense system